MQCTSAVNVRARIAGMGRNRPEVDLQEELNLSSQGKSACWAFAVHLSQDMTGLQGIILCGAQCSESGAIHLSKYGVYYIYHNKQEYDLLSTGEWPPAPDLQEVDWIAF